MVEHDSDVNPRTAAMTAILAIQNVRRRVRMNAYDMRHIFRVNHHLLWKSLQPFDLKT